MNAQLKMMETNRQHEFHPAAESLSAFAEQALEERERGEVLKHLAVCGHCRQVVALAREAAEVEAAEKVAPPEIRRATLATNAWWKSWRLVLVPTAVVAAMAVAAISLYVRQAEQNDGNVRIAEQVPAQGIGPASVPAQEKEAEAAQPASPVAVAPASPAAVAPKKKTLNSERPGEDARSGKRMYKGPLITNALESLNRPPPPPTPAPVNAAQGLVGESFAAQGVPPAFASPASAELETAKRAKSQELVKAQAASSASKDRLFTAKAAAPASEYGAENGARPSGTQVVVLNSEAKLQAAPIASFGGFERSRPSAIAAKSMHLPSGLTATSIASGGNRMLAIDAGGTLFVSQDAGITWVRVALQWSGRAAAVRRQATGTSSAEETHAAKGVKIASADAVGAPSPAVVFELTNDKGQVWLSTDGMTWTAK